MCCYDETLVNVAAYVIYKRIIIKIQHCKENDELSWSTFLS